MEHIQKKLSRLIQSLASHKGRKTTGWFVAEGNKCIIDILKQSTFKCKFLILKEQQLTDLTGIFEPFIQKEKVVENVFWATEHEIKQMSSLVSPQGSIAVFEQRINRPPLPNTLANDVVLCLDGIQDPGNMGTIIRTSDWFGVKHIVCSPTSVDIYNPKVVQASMGTIANVQVSYTNLFKWLTLAKSTCRLCALTSPTQSRLCKTHQTQISKSGVFIFGNEGNGISEPILRLCHYAFCFPSSPSSTAESLNLAASVASLLAILNR